MLAAPAVALLYRALPMVVLPLSVGLYVATLILGWNLPSWPIEGTWFFSPFAWQLIYVLGFLIAGKRTDLGAFGRRNLRTFQAIAIPIVVIGLVIASTRFWDWITLPSLGLPFKVFDKTFMSPDRLASVLALVTLGGGIFTTIDAWLPALTPLFVDARTQRSARLLRGFPIKSMRTDRPFYIWRLHRNRCDDVCRRGLHHGHDRLGA